MGIALLIIGLLVLAVIAVLATARQRSTTGRLSRETRKSDRSTAAIEEVVPESSESVAEETAEARARADEARRAIESGAPIGEELEPSAAKTPVKYVPVDEEHPTVPEDSYAMSEVSNEVTARSFQARTGADVYGLRINNVIEPEEYAELFPPFLSDPSLRRRNLFAYIDVRDLGQMVQRCLETDGLGYEVFNVANADMSVAATTAEVIERFYSEVEVRREMGRDETLYAIDKARALVGFDPQHSWRDVLDDPAAS